MMTRNRQIGMAILADLRVNLTQQQLAGLVLLSLERLIWSDTEALLWAVTELIPSEIMAEIHQLTSVAVYQRLVKQGMVPGRDLSVDAKGRLLINTLVTA